MQYAFVWTSGQIAKFVDMVEAPQQVSPLKGGWWPVVDTAQPAFDPATQYATFVWQVQDLPLHIGGKEVVKVWTVHNKTAEQLAEEAAQAADAANRAAVKTDTFVQNFIQMTPAQVTNYINNNVTDLPSARNVINKLALMLLYMAKDRYQ